MEKRMMRERLVITLRIRLKWFIIGYRHRKKRDSRLGSSSSSSSSSKHKSKVIVMRRWRIILRITLSILSFRSIWHLRRSKWRHLWKRNCSVRRVRVSNKIRRVWISRRQVSRFRPMWLTTLISIKESKMWCREKCRSGLETNCLYQCRASEDRTR